VLSRLNEAGDIGDSGRLDAENGPLGLATRHFLETGLVVHAPAAASDRASLALEDRFEVGPAIWRETSK
jgi:hypothetical protein